MKVEEKTKIKKLLIIAGIGFALILIGILSWKVYFSKYYQFYKQEKALIQAAMSYYETYPRYLPKQEETREVTLERLYDTGTVEILKVPGTDKFCSTDSWVRVYQNKNGEYEYFVNLECDKFKSKIDSEGPKIELNGDSTIIVDYGTEYKDPGVKSVTDNVDGKIDVSKVTIDTSKVNMKKPGLYKVKYTVADKIRNETTVTRNVQVVDKLYSFVKRNTDESNYYKGPEVNNYVQFSGMMWQIINVNEDNSVKIILANASSNVMLGTAEKFTDTNVYRWLNDYFYPHLQNSRKYIVEDAKWCSNEGMYTIEDITETCNGEEFQGPIGLLNVSDIAKSNVNRYNYLKGKQYYWLLDRVNADIGTIIYTGEYDGFSNYSSGYFAGVRPVINLNTDVYILNGNGTVDNPYKLNDYNYAKENTQIKDCLDGEYFSYSGYLFRKTGVDKEGNVRMIMASNLKDPVSLKQYTVEYDKSIQIRKFDIKEKGNVGHTLNEDLILKLSDKYIVKHEFEIPEIDDEKYYDQWKKEKVNAYLAYPTTYELFSNYNVLAADSIEYNFLMMDYSSNNRITFVNTGNSMAFTMDPDILGENAVKVVLYLKGDKKISSGKGLMNSPYYIK